MIPLYLVGAPLAALFLASLSGCSNPSKKTAPQKEEPAKPPPPKSFIPCQDLPQEILGSFLCGTPPAFDPLFKNLNQRVIKGEIPLERAIKPHSPFTAQQMCNRMWRSAPQAAALHCSTSSPRELKLELMASPQSQGLLEAALATAIRLRPDLDPRKKSDWKISPEGDRIQIILLPRREDYRDWRGPKDTAQSGSEISPRGNYYQYTVLDPQIFQDGIDYAASVLAHEFFHVQLQLRGKGHLYPLAQEEILAYDVGIGVLEILKEELQKNPTPENLLRIEQIDRMLLREREEQNTWKASLAPKK